MAIQYSDTYVALLEQKESKLLSTVTNIGAITGTSFTVNEMGTLGDEFDTLTRFGETQYTDASFASRLATMNDFSYGAEAINIAKNNIPFQNVWYSRLVFDRLVIAELQDLFDEGYRERKQRRQESNYNMSYWWDLDNDSIEVPDLNMRS